MNFLDAMAALNEGKRVRRKSWQKGSYWKADLTSEGKDIYQYQAKGKKGCGEISKNIQAINKINSKNTSECDWLIYGENENRRDNENEYVSREDLSLDEKQFLRDNKITDISVLAGFDGCIVRVHRVNKKKLVFPYTYEGYDGKLPTVSQILPTLCLELEK